MPGRESAAAVRLTIGAALLVALLATMLYAFSRADRVDAANARLLDAATGGNLDVIAAALADGADVNFRDSSGVTPLIAATRGDYVGSARFLLRHGASATPCAEVYGSALSWAACFGHPDLVQELLGAGADPNVDSNGLHNPLQMCAMCPRDQGAEVAQILLSAGADPHRLDSVGKTSFDVARSVDNQPVLHVLLAHDHHR